MKTVQFQIEGMHCGGCVDRVRAALGKDAGVTSSTVSVGAAAVTFDDVKTSPAAIRERLEKLGFDLREATT